MRVFIAVDLDEAAKKETEKLLKILKKKYWPVRWELPEKLHITLAFLGNIKNQVLNIKNTNQKLKIEKVLASKTSIKPFSLSFKGLGCFPDYDWPRIIWLGLKGDLKSLAALQKRIEENLMAAGFSFKQRPFSPHITLGRIKKARAGQRREIGRQIKAMQKMDFKSQWLVDRIVIYKSTCLPEGSVYKKLFTSDLEGEKSVN